jgi:hypothetical protein
MSLTGGAVRDYGRAELFALKEFRHFLQAINVVDLVVDCYAYHFLMIYFLCPSF